MKKTILGFVFGLLTISVVHAQQTVVIQRPGIFTDLATALIGVPAATAVGIVEGTVEAVRDVVTGSTTVVRTPAPVIVHQPVATAPVAVQQKQVVLTSPLVTGRPSTTVVTTSPAPVVVAPQVVVQPQVQVVTSVPVAPAPVVTVSPAPAVIAPVPVTVQPRAVAPAPMTTITTVHRDGTAVSVTRPASAYELGGTVITPVDPEHRVGTSPFVNPYVYRHR